MGRIEKRLEDVLSGRRDGNIRFIDLCAVVEAVGFAGRVRGSHHIYWHPNLVEIVNLQPLPDAKAKPYQVKQVRSLIRRYNLQVQS